MEQDRIEATNGLAEAVLEDLRPVELPLMPATQNAFWENGGRLPDARYGKAIGFGDGSQIATALAPVALAVAAFALEVLKDLTKKILVAEGQSVFNAMKKQLVDRKPGEIKIPWEIRAELEARVAAEASRYLSEEHAGALTQAIMERIANSPDVPTPQK